MARRGRKANAKGRSEGEQYWKLPYSMAQSAAWSTLSGAAVKVYVELRCRYNGGNNGRLTLSMDEAARVLWLGKATVSRALDELQAKGFIVLTKAGHWYGRMATEWAVTDKPLGNDLPTNAWREWSKSAPVSVLKRNERGPRKTKVGSNTEHDDPSTVPPENREAPYGSVIEPVRANSDADLGSNTERLYNHSQASEPVGEGAEARSNSERSAKATDLPPSVLGPALLLPGLVVRVPFRFSFYRPEDGSSPGEAGRQHDGGSRRLVSRPLPITAEREAADLAELRRQRDAILADTGATP